MKRYNGIETLRQIVKEEPESWEGTCICTEGWVDDVQPTFGHYNQAGGFCCPHHGNTCGHCHEYDDRPAR